MFGTFIGAVAGLPIRALGEVIKAPAEIAEQIDKALESTDED